MFAFGALERNVNMQQYFRCTIGLVVCILAAGCRSQGAEPTAVLTAAGHHALTFAWTIEKSVTPDNWVFLEGQSGTSQFTVKVTKAAGAESFSVDGQVCVTNEGNETTQDLT